MKTPRHLLAVLTVASAGLPSAPAADPAPRSHAAASIEARRSLFSYDTGAKIAIQEGAPQSRGAATIRDISFVSAPVQNPGRTAAYLVSPRAGRPLAAVLWVHWLGEPATTNRTEFLDEAVDLAGRGAVSLLVDGMWSKPGWYGGRKLEDDYASSVAQVIALRRAIDLLLSQEGAGGIPLGIVGHDYGGMYASIAAGVDSRAKTCVFIACTYSLLDWAFYGKQPASKEDYIRVNRPLELREFVAATAGASILFQYAEHDPYVPLARAQELFGAARAPKQMVVYGGADHGMFSPANIRGDRTEWLVRELGLRRQ